MRIAEEHANETGQDRRTGGKEAKRRLASHTVEDMVYINQNCCKVVDLGDGLEEKARIMDKGIRADFDAALQLELGNEIPRIVVGGREQSFCCDVTERRADVDGPKVAQSGLEG